MLAHPQSQSLVLKVPDPFAIRDLLSKSRIINHGDYNIAVKHTLEATKVLRNIGIDAPAPILSQYKWPGKYKPFAHQLVMSEFLTLNRRGFNLSEPGIGKTAAALWAADWLMNTKRVRKVLILSPLSTLETVWKKDIFDILMHRSAVVVHGDRDTRKDALGRDVDFYIMNHDGVKIDAIAQTISRRADIDLVIIDEVSMFRNASSQKYKKLMKMIRPDQRVWMLTGTPCPNAPTDAWAYAQIINPAGVPKFFGSFKRQTMMQVSQFKWVARNDAYDTAFKAMQPAVRFKKSECLDLPAVTVENRQATLTKQQRRMFEEMKNQMLAEAATTQITAVNAADKINKLRQILCGVIKDPKTEKYIPLDHTPRTAVLMETIEQATAKVIVIVPFKGIIKALAEEVGKSYSVEILNGDVSPHARNRIINDFKTTPNPQVLLCHPKVMAHGLNLTEADMTIFYAPIYSTDEYQQVIERFNRTGQTRKMTVVRIAAHPLEWEIYKLIDTRTITQDNILNLYKSVTQ